MKKIFAFFNKIFKNPHFLKVLSILIAIGVWLYIINVADPRTSNEYTNIPITFVYEGTVPYNNSLMPLITNRNFYVNIRVSGPRTSLFNFSKEKIQASLNFNSVAAEGIYEIPISISLGDDKLSYEIIGDEYVTMEFAKKSSVTLNVDFVRIGSFRSGYTVVNQKITPEQITIEGPKNVIDTISKAEVQIDVSNHGNSIIEIADITLRTVDNMYVDRTYLTIPDPQITVAMALEYRKSVKISATLNNPYGGNESYATASCSPLYIQLQGDENSISSIDDWSIGRIDLSEITGSKKTFELPIPEQGGITVVGGNKTITVTVDLGDATIESYVLTSEILAKCEFLNAPENMRPFISNVSKTITVRALPFTHNELSADSFKLYVDLAAEPNADGDYPLIIDFPANVAGGFMNQYFVSIDFEAAE